jgi:hypothetical protein
MGSIMEAFDNVSEDAPVVYEHVTLVMPGVVDPGQSDEEVRIRLQGYAEQHVEREFKPRWEKVHFKHGSIEYVPIMPSDEQSAEKPAQVPSKIALLTTYIYWEP